MAHAQPSLPPYRNYLEHHAKSLLILLHSEFDFNLDFNQVDRDDRTALHLALEMEKFSRAKILLNEGNLCVTHVP